MKIYLNKYDEEKVGKAKNTKHKIIINEGQEPIAQKRYQEVPQKAKFIKEEVAKILEIGKIRESKSP
jgi:hypothetical protein